MKATEPMDDDDTDEIALEERRDEAALIGESEAKLVRSSLKNFNKGLALLKGNADQGAVFAQESIRIAQELEEYGVAIDIKINKGKRIHDDVMLCLINDR